jgi:hypothetical protein
MIKLWIVFVILAVLIHLAIATVRKMDGKERWSLTKSASYSIIIALLTLAVMSSIVILF